MADDAVADKKRGRKAAPEAVSYFHCIYLLVVVFN